MILLHLLHLLLLPMALAQAPVTAYFSQTLPSCSSTRNPCPPNPDPNGEKSGYMNANDYHFYPAVNSCPNLIVLDGHGAESPSNFSIDFTGTSISITFLPVFTTAHGGFFVAIDNQVVKDGSTWSNDILDSPSTSQCKNSAAPLTFSGLEPADHTFSVGVNDTYGWIWILDAYQYIPTSPDSPSPRQVSGGSDLQPPTSTPIVSDSSPRRKGSAMAAIIGGAVGGAVGGLLLLLLLIACLLRRKQKSRMVPQGDFDGGPEEFNIYDTETNLEHAAAQVEEEEKPVAEATELTSNKDAATIAALGTDLDQVDDKSLVDKTPAAPDQEPTVEVEPSTSPQPSEGNMRTSLASGQERAFIERLLDRGVPGQEIGAMIRLMSSANASGSRPTTTASPAPPEYDFKGENRGDSHPD